ncbi:MAG TPA: 23S rRNA (guanosine(2251)-2'-O)-methyltransferase RlmB [Candidatus Thermoplasmatota archaeon]|nr:23S rRNA (guanosine(2251)-2'-O)-methyltransferase RlmB [Candidatus Thermoplasmatota archaeon]
MRDRDSNAHRRPRDHVPAGRPHRAAETTGPSFVEGRRAVLEALRAGAEVSHLRVAASAEPSRVLDEVVEEARQRRLFVERVPSEVLDALSETGRHQGVIADVRLPEALSVEGLYEKACQGGREPFLVVLDGVEDPQNLGAIARSAEAAGAHGLIVPIRNAAGISPGSLRASAGALLLLPVAEAPNTARALEWLKGKGVWVAGADPEGGRPYHEASLTGPLALVIGGEARGLHRLVRERCDFLVSIPLKGRVESLNASAAAAILLFEAARQRPGPGQKPHKNG